jgi:hypothetical protein
MIMHLKTSDTVDVVVDVVLPALVLLIVIAVTVALMSGCATTPEIEKVEFAGTGSVMVHTDQGSVGGAVEAMGAFVTETGEVYGCPVVTLDVLMETDIGTVDVYGYGVPEDTAGVGIDARCYEDPGPFALRPRSE